MPSYRTFLNDQPGTQDDPTNNRTILEQGSVRTSPVTAELFNTAFSMDCVHTVSTAVGQALIDAYIYAVANDEVMDMSYPLLGSFFSKSTLLQILEKEGVVGFGVTLRRVMDAENLGVPNLSMWIVPLNQYGISPLTWKSPVAGNPVNIVYEDNSELSYDPDVLQIISGFKEQVQLMDDYADFVNMARSGNPDQPRSWRFNSTELLDALSAPTAAGAAFYFGLDTEGMLHIVISVLDEQGGAVDSEHLLERSIPCPPFCGYVIDPGMTNISPESMGQELIPGERLVMCIQHGILVSWSRPEDIEACRRAGGILIIENKSDVIGYRKSWKNDFPKR